MVRGLVPNPGSASSETNISFLVFFRSMRDSISVILPQPDYGGKEHS